MREYAKNMKECVENMKKYEGIRGKYEDLGKNSELSRMLWNLEKFRSLPLYMSAGTRIFFIFLHIPVTFKNSELRPRLRLLKNYDLYLSI